MKLTFDDTNGSHAWYLDGKRASGLSGLGKAIDNTFNLEQWRGRQIAIGVASDQLIAEEVLAHHDDKQQLNAVVERALQKAKADEGARKGTVKHRISERIDLDEDVLLSPEMQRFAANYRAALADYGLTALPDYVERAVVWPDDCWAGRYDRIYRIAEPCATCGGTMRIGDLKSGESAVSFPHSIAVQLTGYAYAPLTAVLRYAGPSRWTAETFEPHPDGLCRCVGLIVHAPSDETVTVHEIDLVPDALDLCRKVRAWQKVKGLTRPAATVDASPRTPADPAVRADIERRVAVLRQHPKALAMLALRWPTDVPTLKASADHDASQLEQIATIVGEVEAEFRIPFPEPVANGEPADPFPDEPTPMVARWVADDGEPCTEDDREATRLALADLDGVQRSIIGAIAAEANDAGRSISVSAVPSRRRLVIARALIAWASTMTVESDVDVIRAGVAAALGTEVQLGVTTGCAVGSLTADEADQFLTLASLFTAGMAELTFVDGRPVIAA